jgi:hypothetical protein
MRRTTAILCATIALSLAQSADAQGPVRRALRGAGEVAVEGARATARGAAIAADAITPGIPAEARLGGPVDRNARWRMTRHNGDWWYYTPENSWMYQRDGEWKTYAVDTYTPNATHAAGYRGVNTFDSQQMVFIDSGGRAVICQNGRITFVDGAELRSVPRAQVNAQGFLIDQAQVQGQTSVGVTTPAPATAQPSTIQTQNQAAVQTDVQPQPAASAQGQTEVQGSTSAPPSAAAPDSSTTIQSPTDAQASAQPSAATGSASISNSTDAATSGSSESGNR